MMSYPLSLFQWFALIIIALYMAYAEGYKGFHLNFSPRVVSRARFFLEQSGFSKKRYVLLAPIFCMGYIHATRKRKIISLSLTSAIIVLVVLVSLLPQPWRGIIDAGVVLGLLLGVLSISYFWFKSTQAEWSSPVPCDFPG